MTRGIEVLLPEKELEFTNAPIEVLEKRGFLVKVFGDGDFSSTFPESGRAISDGGDRVVVVDVGSNLVRNTVDELILRGERVIVIVDDVFPDRIKHFEDMGVRCVTYNDERGEFRSIFDIYKKVADVIDDLVPRN